MALQFFGFELDEVLYQLRRDDELQKLEPKVFGLLLGDKASPLLGTPFGPPGRHSLQNDTAESSTVSERAPDGR